VIGDVKLARLLAIAGGSLEPNSEARDALVELWMSMDEGRLLALLRERDLWDAVAFVKWMSRSSSEYESTHEAPSRSMSGGTATIVLTRPRARASRSRRARGSPRGTGRSPDPERRPEPGLARLRRASRRGGAS
jgi:hypothetical protein